MTVSYTHLAEDQGFRRYFKRYQLPALTNIGTAFGMGLIITSFMVGIASPTGESFVVPALIGNLGAIIGSIISVRLMLMFTAKEYGKTEMCEVEGINAIMYTDYRMVRPGNTGTRFMTAILDGGKTGVDMGLAIIPGVLIICTLVMMFTNGPSADGTYTGAAYEGIALLPALGDKIDFLPVSYTHLDVYKRQDRNQPACLLNRVDGGCCHLCPSGCAGPAVEQILLVVMEGIDGIFGIKKGDDHAAGVVCHPHAGDGHAAADILRCTFGHDAGFDPTDFPGRQSGNLTGRGQVDIGAREIVEQIPNGKDVQLLVERGSLGTHAGQKLYVGIQRRFHAAPH